MVSYKIRLRHASTPEHGAIIDLLLTLEEASAGPPPAAAPVGAPRSGAAQAPHREVAPASSAEDLPNGPASSESANGLGVNRRHAPALDAAARRTGIPVAALAAIVDAEAGKSADGSWKVYSRNPRSSAAGLGQFLSGSWEGLAETGGTWLNAVARAQGWLDGRGQVSATSRAALLALRYEPAASIEATADYARSNLAGLKRAGVPIDGDVARTARLAYLGHHLGLRDAVRFVRDGRLDDARARHLLSAQIGASGSETRIAKSGDAGTAHREWLLGYVARNLRPERFARTGSL